MKITNLLLGINSIFLGALLLTALQITKRLPNYPTVAEIKALTKTSPVAALKRKLDQPYVGPVEVELMNQPTVEISNVLPIEVNVENWPALQHVEINQWPSWADGNAIWVRVAR